MSKNTSSCSTILIINDFIEEVVEEYDTERDEDAGEKKMVKVSKIQKFCSFRLLQTFSTYCDILAGTFKYDLNWLDHLVHNKGIAIKYQTYFV